MTNHDPLMAFVESLMPGIDGSTTSVSLLAVSVAINAFVNYKNQKHSKQNYEMKKILLVLLPIITKVVNKEKLTITEAHDLNLMRTKITMEFT